MAATARVSRSPRLIGPRLWLIRIRRAWPLALWLLAVGLAVLLNQDAERAGGMIGAVETEIEPVAPLETARLLSLHVAEGDSVKAGAVVARMDTAPLDRDLALNEADLAQADSTLAGHQQGLLQLSRQIELALREAEYALETEKVNEARDTAERDELRREQDRRDALFEKKLINEETVNELRPRLAALERILAGYRALQAIHARRLEDMRRAQADMRRGLGLDGDAGVADGVARRQAARAAALATIRDLNARQRAGYELRAARDGMVSRIYHAPGDVVASGDPVARLVSMKVDEVIGFLPEIHIHGLRAGQPARVWRRALPGRKFAALIQSIAPEIQTLPGLLSPIRGQSLRGRRVVVRLTGAHDLVPGETVQIGFGEQSCWDRLLDRLRSAGRASGRLEP